MTNHEVLKIVGSIHLTRFEEVFSLRKFFETKELEVVEVNWRTYRENSYDAIDARIDSNHKSAWSTYEGLLTADLIYDESGVSVDVRCDDGHFMDGEFESIRWTGKFEANKSILGKYDKQLERAKNLHVESVFSQEEHDRISKRKGEIKKNIFG